MVSQFRAATDIFSDEINNIGALVSFFEKPSPTVAPRLRTLASNSGMLLLSATFEGFVREMAGHSARAVVSGASSLSEVPTRLLRTAWSQTFDAIGRYSVPQNTQLGKLNQLVNDAEVKADSVFGFLRGDRSRDIYNDLVTNKSNMRPKEINRLFKISDVSNVCSMVAGEKEVIDHFKVTDSGTCLAELTAFVNEFIEQRNVIAHDLTSSFSLVPSEVREYGKTLCIFGESLCTVLERL